MVRRRFRHAARWQRLPFWQAALLFACLLAVAATTPVWAAPSVPGSSELCNGYMREAERLYGVPRGILPAVALVESGHGGEPWPWTLDIRGKPFFYATPQETLRAMLDSRGRVIQDMDVGCMQINVRSHGARFRTTWQMLDPHVNVLYGAAYLRALYEQYGSWTRAVERYHASDANNPEQRRYVCRVLNRQLRLGLRQLTYQALSYCSGPYARELGVTAVR